MLAARYRHLTTRDNNPLCDGQAKAALAAAVLRWVHVITTERVAWNAAQAGALNLPPAA